MTNPLRYIIVFLLFNFTWLISRGSGSDAPVHFRTFGASVGADDLYYNFKGVDTKVTITDSARSVFYDYAMKGPIVFYRLVPGPDGKPMHEDAAVAQITSTGECPLLVFVKTSDSTLHYTITVIPDDLKSFPFPSCQFINFTPADINAVCGDQSLKIMAQSTGLIQLRLKSPGTTETRYTTLSSGTIQGSGLLYSNNWVMRQTQRTLVFIVPQGDGLQVTRIVDDLGSYANPPLSPAGGTSSPARSP